MIEVQFTATGHVVYLCLWRVIQRAMQAMPRHATQKGGFGAQRHDGVSNLLTSPLSKVSKNAQVEPHLQSLDNELMNLRSNTTSSDTGLDARWLLVAPSDSIFQC